MIVFAHPIPLVVVSLIVTAQLILAVRCWVRVRRVGEAIKYLEESVDELRVETELGDQRRTSRRTMHG